MFDVTERKWSFVRVVTPGSPSDFALVTRRSRVEVDALCFAMWFEVTRLELTWAPGGVPNIGTLTTCVRGWDPTWSRVCTESVPPAVAQVLIHGASSTTVLPFSQRVPRLPTVAARLANVW